MSGVRKPRDYAAEYARRKARLALTGQTPYSARKRGTSVFGPVDQKRSVLAKWGITEREFEAMRIRNANWAAPADLDSKAPRKGSPDRRAKVRKNIGLAIALNTYQAGRDIPGDWSDDRVGYVVSFYHAIVDPATNYESLFTDDGLRKMRTVRGKKKPKMNRWQQIYLVQYSQLMDIDEYEARYGGLER